MNKKHIIITEYGYLARVNKETEGIHLENKKVNHYIDKELYYHIKEWNDKYNKKEKENKNPFFKVETRKIGKSDRVVLVAQNQVGTIQFGNVVIDIIPKTLFIDTIENEESENTKNRVYKTLRKSNQLLLKMLRYSNLPNINILNADLQDSNLPILEIFILSFINELNILIKQGLLSGYVEEEFNSKYFKGKPLWQQHINKNLVNKVNFYIRTTIFTIDRAENRLIKQTIIFLTRVSKSYRNIMNLKQLLNLFQDVNIKNDCKTEFLNVKNDRNTRYYHNTLKYCELFLCKKSSPFGSGDEYKTFSFLFNMENIFEEYVPKLIEDNVETQVSEKHLIITEEELNDKFLLKPDILCRDKNYIADTKWKVIESYNDISQSDVYQMFAYAHKYEVNTIYLIYPKINNESLPKTYKFDKERKLIVSFFDLENDEWIK